MNDVFVSYSRKDREFVIKLVDALKGRGWAVWWDPTIRPGQYYEDVIEGALTTAKCVIVVWSKNSVASKWVRAEAGEAANRGVLVPVVIDNAKIPFRFKQIQEANLTDWQFTPDHPGLIGLLDSIAATLSQNPQPSLAPPETVTEENDDERPSATPLISPQSEPGRDASLSRPVHPSDYRDRDFAREDESSIPTASRIGGPAQWINRATSSDSRPGSKKIILIVAAVLAVGIIAAILYLVPSRRSTDRATADPQTSPSVSLLPSPTKSNSSSPSPSPSPTASPTDSPKSAQKLMVLLEGTWQSQKAPASENCECADSGCLKIDFSRNIRDLCVESNQIYINAYYKLDLAKNKAYLFLRAPGKDLGAGGNLLPWDEFDKGQPLASIDLIDLEAKNTIYVYWHGFRDIKGTVYRERKIGRDFQGAYVKR